MGSTYIRTSFPNVPGLPRKVSKIGPRGTRGSRPKFIQSSFYAKMPPHLKRVLTQARLENESYDEMVADLERQMELNGLANPEYTSLTGIHNVEFQPSEHQAERKKGACDYCGNQGHFKHQCRKLKNDQRNNARQGPCLMRHLREKGS